MASSKIATAYVQIAPSMTGVAPEVKSYFGGAGNEAGGQFSDNLVRKIKAALAGIGIAMKQTIMEGADLEQSLGGIETLFKDSADTVIANAEQAYRTAGMSANSYMENVTSFSASLLQSLGGDTVKAADVADMALRDMSDNANKFGTDLERITDAYQGFAKQNYTMLDNLKLGYGGTQAEMERLLAKAEELTGVEYDISNLSDVYSAIHAIQEDLGVTGATAKEASETLSGSFSAMKSAFSNVLGNLALGREIKPSLKALAETTVTFLKDNLIPAVTNIVTALPGALVTLVEALIPEGMQRLATTAVLKLSTFLRGRLPSLLVNGTEMISQLALGFVNGIPGFLQQIGYLHQTLGSALLSAAPKLLANGTMLILNFVKGLIAALPDIVSSGTNIIVKLLSTFAGHYPDIMAQGISLIGQLVAGLISMIPDVVVAAGDIALDVYNTICEVDWLQLGIDIIDGIIDGLLDAATALYEAIRDIIREALFAGEDEAGSRSTANYARMNTVRQNVSGNSFVAAAKETNAKFTSILRINTNSKKISQDADGISGTRRPVVIHQYIYSEAKTAADLMREARYQAEKAVLFGV